MVRENSEEVLSYRTKYSYNKSFDVALLTSFEPEDGVDKYSFYENIADTVRKLGKSVFVPHIDISLKWGDRKIYNVINNIILPTSDIAISHIGIEYSSAVDTMNVNAQFNKIPLICIKEKSSKAKINLLTFGPKILGTVNFIEFESERDCIDKLVENLKRFYK